MGNDAFVHEVRQGAIGQKLPTLTDMDPSIDKNITNRIETPTSRNYTVRDPRTGAQKPNAEVTPEQLAMEISSKIDKLHTQGKSLDEMFDILRRDGYEYAAIEPVLVDFLAKYRLPPKGPDSSQGTFSKQGSASPVSSGVRQNQQTNTQGTLPSVASSQIKKLSPSQDNVEIVEIPGYSGQQINRDGIGSNSEEVPTTVPKSVSAPQIIEGSGAGVSVGGDFAPLFVKVGKYKEALEQLNDLENYLRGMNQLLGLVEELEKVRVMNISAINKMHKRALETTMNLSSGLLKPRGMQVEGTRESEVELNKLGDVITDLSKELSILKKEVDKLGKV